MLVRSWQPCRAAPSGSAMMARDMVDMNTYGNAIYETNYSSADKYFVIVIAVTTRFVLWHNVNNGFAILTICYEIDNICIAGYIGNAGVGFLTSCIYNLVEFS